MSCHYKEFLYNSKSISSTVRVCVKILYRNFMFIHHEAKVGMWFYMVKTAIQVEICDASYQKCGTFYSPIQANSHPDSSHTSDYLIFNIFCLYHCLFLLFDRYWVIPEIRRTPLKENVGIQNFSHSFSLRIPSKCITFLVARLKKT